MNDLSMLYSAQNIQQIPVCKRIDTNFLAVGFHDFYDIRLQTQVVGITMQLNHVICLCFSSVKLLSKQEAHAKDEKLSWELLKGKRKYQTPESPLGPKELLFSKKHHKSTTLMPAVSHRPITRILSRGLGPHSPRLDPRIPLGSSPSVAI